MCRRVKGWSARRSRVETRSCDECELGLQHISKFSFYAVWQPLLSCCCCCSFPVRGGGPLQRAHASRRYSSPAVAVEHESASCIVLPVPEDGRPPSAAVGAVSRATRRTALTAGAGVTAQAHTSGGGRRTPLEPAERDLAVKLSADSQRLRLCQASRSVTVSVCLNT